MPRHSQGSRPCCENCPWVDPRAQIRETEMDSVVAGSHIRAVRLDTSDTTLESWQGRREF